MRIIGPVVTANSEQPIVVVDLASLTLDLQKKIQKELDKKSNYVVVTANDVGELFSNQVMQPYPCMIDAEIEFIEG